MNYNQYIYNRVAPKIWYVTCDSQFDLAMLFLRPQEYYESPKFKGQIFWLDEYMAWYSSISQTGHFTYPQDWEGFNVPSTVIFGAIGPVPEEKRSMWDYAMVTIALNIARAEQAAPFYVIGARVDNPLAYDHEMAHALYFTNSQYRKTMKKLVEEVPEIGNIFEYLRAIDGGYHESVLVDEVQAYFATGLCPGLKEYKKYTKPFKAVFKEAMSK